MEQLSEKIVITELNKAFEQVYGNVDKAEKLELINQFYRSEILLFNAEFSKFSKFNQMLGWEISYPLYDGKTKMVLENNSLQIVQNI